MPTVGVRFWILDGRHKGHKGPSARSSQAPEAVENEAPDAASSMELSAHPGLQNSRAPWAPSATGTAEAGATCWKSGTAALWCSWHGPERAQVRCRDALTSQNLRIVVDSVKGLAFCVL
jgi:hypothetical protein